MREWPLWIVMACGALVLAVGRPAAQRRLRVAPRTALRLAEGGCVAALGTLAVVLATELWGRPVGYGRIRAGLGLAIVAAAFVYSGWLASRPMSVRAAHQGFLRVASIAVALGYAFALKVQGQAWIRESWWSAGAGFLVLIATISEGWLQRDKVRGP